MSRTSWLSAALVLFGFVFTANAGWIISSNVSNNSLHDYTQGGAATNPRTITGLSGTPLVIGIDFSGAGELFGFTTTSDNRLYKINPATGVATGIGAGNPTASVIEGDVGFDPTSGILYGLWNSSVGQRLFTVNTTSGVLTNGPTVAGDDPSGLAFDNSGNLFVILSNINGSKQPQLLRVDKITGAILSTQSMGITVSSPLLGADFDPTTNTLYMAGGDGGFYSVNTATGLATLVANHNVVGATGLAYVPEPASASLLLLGAASAPVLSRRRSRNS